MKPNKFFLIASMTFLISCSPKNVLVPDDQLNAINALVDGLHLDAHEGNFETYFDRYSTNAIFLGTDKTERWTIEEFKAYAKPAFDDGNGWSYIVIAVSYTHLTLPTKRIV